MWNEQRLQAILDWQSAVFDAAGLFGHTNMAFQSAIICWPWDNRDDITDSDWPAAPYIPAQRSGIIYQPLPDTVTFADMMHVAKYVPRDQRDPSVSFTEYSDAEIESRWEAHVAEQEAAVEAELGDHETMYAAMVARTCRHCGREQDDESELVDDLCYECRTPREELDEDEGPDPVWPYAGPDFNEDESDERRYRRANRGW